MCANTQPRNINKQLIFNNIKKQAYNLIFYVL